MVGFVEDPVVDCLEQDGRVVLSVQERQRLSQPCRKNASREFLGLSAELFGRLVRNSFPLALVLRTMALHHAADDLPGMAGPALVWVLSCHGYTFFPLLSRTT